MRGDAFLWRYAPSAPRMMVKVLLYAYATGVFSARGIARKLEEDGAFRVLGAGNFPQHRTLCEFRRRHLSDFKELFVAVGRLARAWGLARVGKLSIDGTKVRANASKRKAMSDGRMAKEERRLRGEIAARLAAAKKVSARPTSCRRSCAAGKRASSDATRQEEIPGQVVWGRGWRRTQRAADELPRGVGAAGKTVWRRIRAATVAVGGEPDAGSEQLRRPRSEPDHEDRNPRAGQPYTRSYGGRREGAEQLVTDPEVIMKTSNDGFQQLLQRAGGSRVADGAHEPGLVRDWKREGERPGWCVRRCSTGAEHPETVGEQPERSGRLAGYSRPQRAVAVADPTGNARHRVCVAWAGGEGAARPRDPALVDPADESMAEKLLMAAGTA